MSNAQKPVVLSGLTGWASGQNAWVRIFTFLLVLALGWLPLAAMVYLPQGWFYDSNTAEIVVLALLYVGFLCLLPWWGRQVHQWKFPVRRCGLIFQRQTGRDLAIALVIGVFGVFALFGIETGFGWAVPSSPSPRIVRFVIEGLIMALAVGLAEELLFRGWVLAELEKGYSATASLVMNALFFAGTHFIRPLEDVLRTLPQFLGLVLLAVALVWARRSPTGLATTAETEPNKKTRLGYPIGLHAGLIWGYYIVNVGGLSEYTGRAPEWVTGIDDNPLAGLLGLILLGLIARQFQKTAVPKS